jgi:hypothetical protein
MGDLLRDHLRKQFVQAHRIGCGVRARDGALTDADLHRADQAALVAQRTEQAEEQRGRARLAIGTGDADELQLLRRRIVEVGGELTEGLSSVLNTHVGHTHPSTRQGVPRR